MNQLEVYVWIKIFSLLFFSLLLLVFILNLIINNIFLYPRAARSLHTCRGRAAPEYLNTVFYRSLTRWVLNVKVLYSYLFNNNIIYLYFSIRLIFLLVNYIVWSYLYIAKAHGNTELLSVEFLFLEHYNTIPYPAAAPGPISLIDNSHLVSIRQIPHRHWGLFANAITGSHINMTREEILHTLVGLQDIEVRELRKLVRREDLPQLFTDFSMHMDPSPAARIILALGPQPHSQGMTAYSQMKLNTPLLLTWEREAFLMQVEAASSIEP